MVTLLQTIDTMILLFVYIIASILLIRDYTRKKTLENKVAIFFAIFTVISILFLYAT